MQQQAGPSGAQCPACGVAVLPGYPNCPRCRAALAPAPPPTASRAPSSVGGTSVVSGPDRRVWIAAGAAAAGGLALLLALVTGDAPEETEPTPPVAAEPAAEEEIAPARAGAPDDEPALAEAPGEGEPAAAASDAALDALEALEHALSSRRLWSTVRVAEGEDQVVSIQSAACDDPDMGPAIGEVRPELVEAGFRSVRCLARHGGLVFEADL